MYCLIVFTFFLKYTTNAKYMINSWTVTPKSTPTIPNNFVQVPNLTSIFQCVGRAKRSVPSCTFRSKVSFYGEDLTTCGPNPKLMDHALSAIRDCLFNIFAASFHVGVCSTIHDLLTRHVVVTDSKVPVSVDHIVQVRLVGWWMNSRLERMWKKLMVA